MIYQKPYLDLFQDRLRVYVTQDFASQWLRRLRDAGITTRIVDLPLTLRTRGEGPFETVSIINVTSGTVDQVKKVLAT